MRYWTIIGCVALFAPPALLGLLGWDMFVQDGAAWMKFHPATYLLLFCALWPVAARQPAMLRLMKLPQFRVYAAAAALLAIWAVVRTGGESGGGELSAAIVTFATPVFLLLALTALSTADASGLGRYVHALLILNSVVALIDYGSGTPLLPPPGPIEFIARSYGLFGHPLASAGMCGLMLVRLLLATDDDRSPATRGAEIVLHAVALLTFGGRAAMLCVPIATVAAILLARPQRGRRAIGPVQRSLVFGWLLLGAMLLTVPIGVTQTFLGRFGEDAGSAGTRFSAFAILGSLGWDALLFGSNVAVREVLRIAFDTETAVEIAWINLVLSYGLIATVMIAGALLALVFRMTRDLDVSAWGMAVYFFLLQSTSLGFGSKSVVIAQMLLMTILLCGAPARASRNGEGVRPQGSLSPEPTLDAAH